MDQESDENDKSDKNSEDDKEQSYQFDILDLYIFWNYFSLFEDGKFILKLGEVYF